MKFFYINKIFYKNIILVLTLLFILFSYFYTSIYLFKMIINNTNQLYRNYAKNNGPDILFIYYKFNTKEMYNFAAKFPWCCVGNYGFFFIVNKGILYNISLNNNSLTIISEVVPPLEAVPFEEAKRSVILIGREKPDFRIPGHINITVLCSDKVIVRKYRLLYVSYNNLTERDKRILDFIDYRYKYYFILQLSRLEDFVTYWTIRGCLSETPVLVGEFRADSEDSETMKLISIPTAITLYKGLGVDSPGVRAWKEPYINAIVLYNELLVSIVIHMILGLIVLVVLALMDLRVYWKYVKPGLCNVVRLLESLGLSLVRLRIVLLIVSIIFISLYYIIGNNFINKISINFNYLYFDSIYYLSLIYVLSGFLLGLLPIGVVMFDVERGC